jgi:hypothetical protein
MLKKDQRLRKINMETVFFYLAFLANSGCYEGWEDPSAQGPGQGPLDGPLSPPGVNLPKRYSYSLLTTIRLAPAGMASSKCFPTQDLKEFRTTEWQDRALSLGTVLGELSEKVVSKEVSVPVNDCTALGSVLNEALKEAPWLPESAPASDPLGRLMVHVKAVLWEGEPAAAPSPPVAKEDWISVSSLKAKGIRSKSLSYFVIANGGSGYFTQWQRAIPKTTWMSGNPINQVDPSDQGAVNRRNVVSKDQAEFKQWLQEIAQ